MTLSSLNTDTVECNNCTVEASSDWKVLYNSELWRNSDLRQEILKTPFKDNRSISCCYTCRGKIRTYEISSPTDPHFLPKNHSTPKVNQILENNRHAGDHFAVIEEGRNEPEIQSVPSISRRVDSNSRQKYAFTEYNTYSNLDQRRLRKSLKVARCILDLASTESLAKKKTQLKVCSISVMVLAVVVISLVLVNFSSPSFLNATNKTSTTIVPTKNIEQETSSAIVSNQSLPTTTQIDSTAVPTTDVNFIPSTTRLIVASGILGKIRKNIKTYPKIRLTEKPKDIINRDLSQKFCSCQKNEVCMLDEDSGTSTCKVAADLDDPTGCGGLCAMETEACQLVDKERGIRVCRLLTLETCAPHDWQCKNGLCVPAEARCDGSIQCYDRSDEKQCDCDLTKEFRCGHSLSCFPNKKLCDGVIDCWDGHDEINCTLAECSQDQFLCNDGQCVMSSRFCDGFADCVDGSDEPHGCDGACGTHEMQCENHRCISMSLRCDGRDDCGDHSDEIECMEPTLSN